MRKSNLKKAAAGAAAFVLVLAMAATSLAQGVPEKGAEPVDASGQELGARVHMDRESGAAPLVSSFLAANGGGVVEDENGSLLDGAERVRTGATHVLNGSRSPIVVMGDVTGSGQMSVSQTGTLSAYLRNASSLNGSYALAADVNTDGAVDSQDLEAMISDLMAMQALPETQGSSAGIRISSSAHAVRPGDTVDLTLTSPGAGADALIATSGLRYMGMKGPGNNRRCLILTDGEPVVYSYMVTAAAGETVSFTLSDTQVAAGGRYPASAADSVWSRKVGSVSYNVPQPKIFVSGDVLQGEKLTIQVSNSDEFTTADIATSGLRFESLKGSGSRDQLRLLGGGSGAVSVYTYEVIAAPGQTAGFWLKNIKVSLDENEEPMSAEDASWTAKVGSLQEEVPAQAYPVIQGPTSVIPGEEIAVTMSLGVGAYGTEARIETTGLSFESVSDDVCSENSVVLLPTNRQTTYRYRVLPNATSVSIRLADVWLCLNPDSEVDTRVSDVNWSARIASGSSAEPSPGPGASAAPENPGDHAIGIPAGGEFEFSEMADGSVALKGLPAVRRVMTAADYRRELTALQGGSLEFLGATGNRLSDEDAVYTGCRVRAVSASGAVLEEATIIVRGDVRGTGAINISQLTSMAGYLMEDVAPTELELLAADHNANGKVDITDLVVESMLLLGEYA